MRKPWMTLAAAMFVLCPWAGKADYSGCEACHDPSVGTCNGCHSHGTHSSLAMNDINIVGTTDATSYGPSSTVTVTVNGGFEYGWVRVLLLDQNLNELARSSCPGGKGGCTTSAYPVTLAAKAPPTPGTYTWAVAWYGNESDISGASFGQGTSSSMKVGYFTPDPSNPNHGYQTVALAPFTVGSNGSTSATPSAPAAGGCSSSGEAAGLAGLAALLFLLRRRRRPSEARLGAR